MDNNLSELEREAIRKAASALMAMRLRAKDRDEYIRLTGLASTLKMVAGDPVMVE